MDDCIFCKIIKGEIPCSKLYENDDFLVFMDIAPVNKGHALVVTKEHHKDFSELPASMGNNLIDISNKVARAIIAAVGADGFNFSTNIGKAAGQAVFHTHFHIIPRFDNDNHIHWEHGSYEDGEMEEYTEKIAKHL